MSTICSPFSFRLIAPNFSPEPNHGTCQGQRSDSTTDGMSGETLSGPPAGQEGVLLLLLELAAQYWLECH